MNPQIETIELQTLPAVVARESKPEPVAEVAIEGKPRVELELLKPFPLHSAPRVWMWQKEFHRPLVDDFTRARSIDEFVNRWEQHKRLGGTSWGVSHQGDLGGVIIALPVTPILAQISATFRRSFCVGDVPIEALRLALRDLFESGVRKVTTTLFSNSHAAISIACQLGGKREGLFEKHTLRSGRPANLVVIGLQKENFKNG